MIILDDPKDLPAAKEKEFPGAGGQKWSLTTDSEGKGVVLPHQRLGKSLRYRTVYTRTESRLATDRDQRIKPRERGKEKGGVSLIAEAERASTAAQGKFALALPT